MERKSEFKRLTLEDVDKLCENISEIETTKEKALELIRIISFSNKEHLLGFKIPYEKLKSKITDRINGQEIIIKDMEKEDAIEYLTNNFYK